MKLLVLGATKGEIRRPEHRRRVDVGKARARTHPTRSRADENLGQTGQRSTMARGLMASSEGLVPGGRHQFPLEVLQRMGPIGDGDQDQVEAEDLRDRASWLRR